MTVPVNNPSGKGPLHLKASHFCHLHWLAQENILPFLTYLSLLVPLGHRSCNDTILLLNLLDVTTPPVQDFFLKSREDGGRQMTLPTQCLQGKACVEVILGEQLGLGSNSDCR